MTPVPMQSNHTNDAFDSTAAIISVFKWQFMVNVILVIFTAMVLLGLFFKFQEKYECTMACMGIIVLVIWLIGTIVVDV